MATLRYWLLSSAWLTFRWWERYILKLLQRNVTRVTAQDLDIKSILDGGGGGATERERQWSCLRVELSKGPLHRNVAFFFFFFCLISPVFSPLLQKYAALVHPATTTQHSHCNIYNRCGWMNGAMWHKKQQQVCMVVCRYQAIIWIPDGIFGSIRLLQLTAQAKDWWDHWGFFLVFQDFPGLFFPLLGQHWTAVHLFPLIPLLWFD